MASFSPSPIPLLFLTLLFSAVPIKPYPLDNICKQTKNPTFCYNLLQPHADADLPELDRTVIDAAYARATTTSAKIQSLLSGSSDPNLKVVYSLCSNYYSAAVTALAAAAEELKSRDYSALSSAATTVSQDAAFCQKAFAMAPSQPIPIADDNGNLELLSDIFGVVSRLLSG